MRLYTIVIDGAVVDWAGTQAEAKTVALARTTQEPRVTALWREADVPTDKPGLLAWLKQHAVSKPGEPQRTK